MAKQMLTAKLEGEIMSPEQLQQFDIFKDVKEATLEKFPGSVVKRTFRAGEQICRQGEGGTTAFYIVEGTVRVYIERSPAAMQEKKKSQLRSFVDKLFGQATAPKAPTHHDQKLVPIDASVDLPYGDLATTMGADEVFGEMSCLNLAPRSATVVAESDCVMLEVLRNMYEQLQKSKTFKAKMDENYRARALSGHLRNVPVFAGLEQEDVDHLRDRAELLAVPAGQPVFNQGDESDGLYIVRLGQVKVSQKMYGGERTLAYLTRGDCFGEKGLLRGVPRNATCSAVDHPIIEGQQKRRPAQCELVRISPEDVTQLLEKYPDVRKRLERLASSREKAQEEAAVSVGTVGVSERAENLGLLQGQNLMLIDLERCTRCDQCVDACVAAHDDGVPRLIREGNRFEKYLVPSTCRMCRDPACMIGCPVGSIRRTQDLNILIEDWCIGCGVCAKQCPYDAIQMHEIEEFGEQATRAKTMMAESESVVSVTERAAVCDQCNSLPTGPACVYACPHDAAMRVNAAKFFNVRRSSILTLGTPTTETAPALANAGQAAEQAESAESS